MDKTCPACCEDVAETFDCDECYDEICPECVKHPLDLDGDADEDVAYCNDCAFDHERKNPEVYQREERFSHYLPRK